MKSIADNTLFQNWTALFHHHFNSGKILTANDRLFYPPAVREMFGKAGSVLLLMNHRNHGFECISDNIKALLGYDQGTFATGKVQFKMSLMHPDHVRIFVKHIQPVMFELMHQYKKSDRLKELNFYFTYQIRKNDGQYIWVSEKMNIIEVDENGNPLVSMVLMDNMNLLKSHDAAIDFIVNLSQEQYYHEPMVRMHYTLQEKSGLSGRELEVFRLLSEGKSSSEIAAKLNISYHTVCTHRKNMLHKTDSKNLMELLHKVKNKSVA